MKCRSRYSGKILQINLPVTKRTDIKGTQKLSMDGWKARNKNFLAWIVASDAFYIHYNTIDIKGLDTPAELNGRNKLRG